MKYEKYGQTFVKTNNTVALKKMASSSVDLIITSPPYNTGKKYEKAVDIDLYLKEQSKVIDELVRVLSDSGSICWQVGNYVNNKEVFPLDIFYYKIFKEHGFKLRNRIIWKFGHGLHARTRFSGRYETILWFTKSDEYTFNLDDVRVPSKYPGKRHFKGPNKGKLSGNPLGKNPGDIWDIMQKEWDTCVWDIPNVKSMHPEKTIHPCQFPVELVERLILALTDEDGVVLDPYAGVGSVAIAAMKTKRKSISFEKEKDYYTLATERIDLFFQGKLKTRNIGTKIYTPTGKDKVSEYPKEWKEIGAAK